MKLKIGKDELEVWKPWFAWYPIVTYDGHLVWLENVVRFPMDDDGDFHFIYKLKDD